MTTNGNAKPVLVGYPKIKETQRPFRFWNEKTKRYLPYYNYKHKRHAQDKALIEAKWSKGAVIAVVDTRNGKLLGQYMRVGNEIIILEP